MGLTSTDNAEGFNFINYHKMNYGDLFKAIEKAEKEYHVCLYEKVNLPRDKWGNHLCRTLHQGYVDMCINFDHFCYFIETKFVKYEEIDDIVVSIYNSDKKKEDHIFEGIKFSTPKTKFYREEIAQIYDPGGIVTKADIDAVLVVEVNCGDGEYIKYNEESLIKMIRTIHGLKDFDSWTKTTYDVIAQEITRVGQKMREQKNGH
jgi:hypothetical protein